MGKINQSKVAPRDIIGLKQSLSRIPELKEILYKIDDQYLNKIRSDFVDTFSIVELISSQLNDEVPVQIKQGNIIREGINKKLDELRKLILGGKQWIDELEKN